MDIKDKYEKAVAKRNKVASSIKGGMTETKQAELDAATDEVIKFRNKLIEAGEWDGPIPMPVKKKYR